MKQVPIPSDESRRLAALRRLEILDTPPTPEFDALAQAALLIGGTPIGMVTLVDSQRTWFKASVGFPGVEGPRELSLCAHAILGSDILEIQDLAEDERFLDHPLREAAPDIRFYAGVPLCLQDGSRVGVLCVIDRQPQRLDDSQRALLRCLAQTASAMLEGWRARRAELQHVRDLLLREAHLAAVIEATSIGTFAWNVQTGALEVNERWAGILGHTLAELAPLSHQTRLDKIHPDDLPRFHALWQRHIAGETDRYENEYRLRHRDGHWVWVACHGRVMRRTTDGRPEWLLGTLGDISERKQQEAALRQSEELLQRISELVSVGGWELDLASNAVSWSKEMRSIRGLAPDYQPTLEAGMAFYPPDVQVDVRDTLAQAAIDGRSWDKEWPLIRADGRPIWVRAAGSVSFHEGKPVRMSGAVQDITDRVAERTALQDAHERLRIATEVGGVGIWDWAIATNVMTWDARMFELYGTQPREGQETVEIWSRHLHIEDRAAAEQAIQEALAGTRPFETDFRVVWEDGSVHHIRAAGVVTRDTAGTPIRMVGTNWDITARVAEQQALQDANDRLRLATDSGGIGIWDCDVLNNLLSWDVGMMRLYGLPPVAGMSELAVWLGRLHPDDRDAAEQALVDAVIGTRPFDMQFRIIWDGGSVHHIRGAGLVTRNAAGEAVRLVGINWDVTASVLQQQALRESNERLQMATDSGKIGIWDWDIANDCLFWDERSHQLFGLLPAELMAAHNTWREVLHPDDRPATEQALSDALEGLQPYDTQFRVIWRDGTVRHVHAIGRVSRDADGYATRMVGTHQDVTDQHRLAAELARQNELLQVTLKSIGDGVITLDGQGDVLWLNPSAERMTGWRTIEARGRAVTEVVQPIDESSRVATVIPVAQCLAEGIEVRLPGRTVLISRDGDEFGIEDTTAPIRNDAGTILGVVLVFRDVTSQRLHEAERAAREREMIAANAELEQLATHLSKARDAAIKASHAKSRFLAGMSHELRTPLNGILGYAQILRLEGGLNATQSTRLQAMQGAGNHLLRMINSVLDMSEIEAEHVTLQIVEVDLAEVLSECLDVVGAQAEAKGLSLSLSTACAAPRRLNTDATRLRQVLLNLLGNAVKFTKAGSIELRLLPAIGREAARLEVADTGPGIPAELRARLFQDFERLDTRAAATIEGSGLGLALSARLATLLGGRIGQHDRQGGGSVFWLELPMTIGDATPPAEPAPAVTVVTPLLPPEARSLRVLVADDVAMNREVVQSFLRSANHEVTCVEGGAEAVAAATSADFDVILMDVRMPEVDGLEATRRIRRLPGRRGQVPIVGLTAQAFAEQVAECRKAGMGSHLGKPFSAAGLLETVAQAASVGRAHDNRAAAENSMTTASVAAPAIGPEWPIIDEEVAEGLLAYLSVSKINEGLENIESSGETLLRRLAACGAKIPADDEISADVHALSGTAGLFGFARLAGVGKQFERAVKTGAADVPELADRLRVTIEATVQQIRGLLAVSSRPRELVSAGATDRAVPVA